MSDGGIDERNGAGRLGEGGPARRRARLPAGGTRAMVAGTVAVGLAAVAAVAAISTARQQGDAEPTPTSATTEAPGPGGGSSQRRLNHEFTAAYTGPVWLTVRVGDGSEHELELTWGPWRRWFTQRETGPVTYWFEKKDADSVPVSVDVPEGVEASFGEGPLPEGAIDSRAGWSRRPPSAVGDKEPPTTAR